MYGLKYICRIEARAGSSIPPSLRKHGNDDTSHADVELPQAIPGLLSSNDCETHGDAGAMLLMAISRSPIIHRARVW